MLLQSNLYHFGIITTDFDGTVSRLTREIGLTWSPLIEVTVGIWTRDFETREMSPRAIYSREQPCFEVVQAVPGTPLVPIAGRPIHHLGYWTDDLLGESEALLARGCPRIMCAVDRGKLFGMAYHELAGGLIVELVDRRAFADWPAFLAGRMQHEVLPPA